MVQPPTFFVSAAQTIKDGSSRNHRYKWLQLLIFTSLPPFFFNDGFSLTVFVWSRGNDILY